MVSIIAGALVGIAGIVVGALVARGQWLHAERLAWETRIQARRGETYVEVLTAVRRITTAVARNARILRSPGDAPPPPGLDDETLFRLETLLALHGSEQVRTSLTSWSDACALFWEKMSQARPEHRPYPPNEMREAAEEVVAAEEVLQAAARDDLARREKRRASRR